MPLLKQDLARESLREVIQGQDKHGVEHYPLEAEVEDEAISDLRPVCEHCEKRHEGECRRLTGGCFQCGALDHMIRDCPKRSGVSGIGSESIVQGPRTSNVNVPYGRGRG